MVERLYLRGSELNEYAPCGGSVHSVTHEPDTNAAVHRLAGQNAPADVGAMFYTARLEVVGYGLVAYINYWKWKSEKRRGP
jgi:hypothetical protein